MELDPDALPDTGSDDAESGQAVHAALAGEPIRELSAEEEAVRERLAEKADEFDVPEGATRLVEQKMSFLCKFEGEEFTITGHPDLVVITQQAADADDEPTRGRAHLIDYKTGRGDYLFWCAMVMAHRAMPNQRDPSKKRVAFWATEEERKMLREAAEEAGFDNLADYFRHLIEIHRKKRRNIEGSRREIVSAVLDKARE